MTKQKLLRLYRDPAGSSSIEFAVTALVLMILTIGMVEAGLMYWSWQALQGAATDAARCAAINHPSCQNVATVPANTQSYASAAAATRGLSSVTAANVTVTTTSSANVSVTTGPNVPSACGGSLGTVSVAVTYQIVPTYMAPLPSTITASACYPLTSS